MKKSLNSESERERIYSSDNNEDQAKNELRLAKQDFNEGRYFDALQRLELSIQHLDSPVLSKLLCVTHFNTYRHLQDAYLLSASCFFKMELYQECLNQCQTVLAIDESNAKALKIKNLALNKLSP